MKAKSLTCLFLALMVGLSCFGQSIKSWKTMNLYGKVKSLKEYCTETKFPEGETMKQYEFDKNGNVTLWADYSYNKLNNKETYTFNKGLMTEEIVYSKYDEPLITRKYKYDKYGNLSQTWTDGKVEKESYKTDRNGRIIETGGDFFGMVFKDYFSYDAQGNKVKNLTYKNNKLYFTRHFFYDNHNNLIKATVFDEKGQLSSKDTYSYDDKKNKIKHLTYNGQTISSTYLYYYDDKNNLISEIGYKGNQEKKQYQVRNTYIFDEQGNWIIYNHYKDGIETPKYVYKREIEYY